MPKPIKKLTSGALEASIWANEVKKDGKSLTFYSVRIDKNYKDKEGKWKKSTNYNFNEILVVSHLAERCYEYLVEYDPKLKK